MSHYKTYALYTCHLFFVSVIYSQLISSNNNWTNGFNWEEGFIKSFILFYLVIKYTLITYNIHTTYFNDIWIIGNKVKEKICSPQSWLKECTAKIPQFHLISWCGNFVERHSFSIVSGVPPKNMRKLCLSTKFPHQKIMWNYDIFRNVIQEKLFH